MSTVRRFAADGRFVPGEPIVVTELAAEVGFSPTPLREALACLAGEGLIERRRGRGYFYPELSPAELIDLFELQLAYVHAALTLWPRGIAPLRKAVGAIDPHGDAQALFGAIVAQSGNQALISAHGRVAERLKAALSAGGRDEGEAWTVRAMLAAIAEGRIAVLIDLLRIHHEHRCARIPVRGVESV
ncbi:GntR family transcriptional regulator [Brevundimonas viscosa]|uniref:GntR family transcriptional regulator n=1 Tax=Brevundimonas viscosa TaxID=871741 RepID=UPI0015A632CB|nr:GntR family transcriptional regulator [Brevundimonas viscosa]